MAADMAIGMVVVLLQMVVLIPLFFLVFKVKQVKGDLLS